jgi:hypothetical protein
MTIYKWWESRLHLLIDAYLRQATLLLPISETEPPAQAIRTHAAHYLHALQGDLGRVQMAVLAECLAETGDSGVFVDRYLSIRRAIGLRVIRCGQGDGSIAARFEIERFSQEVRGARIAPGRAAHKTAPPSHALAVDRRKEQGQLRLNRKAIGRSRCLQGAMRATLRYPTTEPP